MTFGIVGKPSVAVLFTWLLPAAVPSTVQQLTTIPATLEEEIIAIYNLLEKKEHKNSLHRK